MKAGIIQPNYIPWRGYLDFISSVDIFVFFDDVQYTARDWRNRNLIRTNNGLKWLTVPVQAPHRINICDVKICEDSEWRECHLKQIYASYATAPFFKKYYDEFASLLMEHDTNLSQLDIKLLKWLMQTLNIETETIISSSLQSNGVKTEKLLDILTKIGADRYLSGPAASAYLDTTLLKEHGITVEYKTYDYKPYPQIHAGHEFNVSVLDMLFNTGDAAVNYLKSLTPNILVK